MKLLPLVVEELGLLNKFEHEAKRRFWRSFEGVDDNPPAFIRSLGSVEDRGEIMEDTARFKRLLVGVLLKLNARLTFFCSVRYVLLKFETLKSEGSKPRSSALI